MKLLFKAFVYSAITLVAILIFSNLLVFASTIGQIYTVEDAPNRLVALVLGTSKNTIRGEKNSHFESRMDAATKLYQEGLVRHILVSGDNETIYYNEPRDMYVALSERDIPKEKITLDYAGFRTLDSIVRCLKVFEQDDVVIVTQRFHCYRALYIANHYSLNAIAVKATDERESNPSLIIREFFARPLALIDLHLLNTQPRYLGKPEPIDL